LALAAITCLSKCYNDVFYSNQLIAQVGGVSLEELNNIELDFLTLMNWDIHISEEEFNFYYTGFKNYS